MLFVIGCGDDGNQTPTGSGGAGGGDVIQIEKPENAIEGQYLFFLDDQAVMPEQVKAVADELLASQGGVLLEVYDSGFLGFSANNLDDTKTLAIAKDKRVKTIGQDCRVKLQETQANASWNLDRIDSQTFSLDSSYTYFYDGGGVHVYVVDSGIRATHQEFGGRVSGGWTFVKDGKGTDDCNGHGTHVAGIIGGATYGVAKGVFLHPIRVADCQGNSSASVVLAAVNWVNQDKRSKGWPAVVNMSLTVPEATYLEGTIYQSMLIYKYPLIASVGDDTQSAGLYSPIGAVTVLSVGATDKTDTRAPTSNYGSLVQMFAPGVDIVAASHVDDTSTTTKSGTSMAAAHVSGVAAMYMQAHPEVKDGNAVRMAILAGAGKDLVKDPKSGQNNMLYSRFLEPKVGFLDTKVWDGGANSDTNGILDKVSSWQTLNFADVTGDGRDDTCHLRDSMFVCQPSNGTVLQGAPGIPWQPWQGVFDPAVLGAPNKWATTRFADVNGDGKADVCMRTAAGIQCALSTGTEFGTFTQWDTYYTDAGPWDDNPSYWATIQYADINGDKKMDVCGRAVNGVVCELSTGTSFASLAEWSPFFSDANGWAVADNLWATIRFPDLNGDGKADVCGRHQAGIVCGLSTGTTFEPVKLWDDYYTDAGPWDDAPAYWQTIQYADIDGNKKMDVCGRAVNGIVCRRSTGTTFGPVELWEPFFSDPNGWAVADNLWGTITYPDINGDGRADVCGRHQAGIVCGLSTGTKFTLNTVWDANFSDVAGWATQPYYWSTIRYPDVDGDGKSDVCGRSKDGVMCGLAPTP